MISDVKHKCITMRASFRHALYSSCPTITVANDLPALHQVNINTTFDPRREPAATMMKRTVDACMQDPEAKRLRIEDLKKDTLFFGFGKTGHWLNDL